MKLRLKRIYIPLYHHPFCNYQSGPPHKCKHCKRLSIYATENYGEFPTELLTGIKKL